MGLLLLFFLPDWTDHWVSGAAGGGAALVAAVGVSFVSELAFEVGFPGDGGADMIVLYCSLGLSFSQLEDLWLSEGISGLKGQDGNVFIHKML